MRNTDLYRNLVTAMMFHKSRLTFFIALFTFVHISRNDSLAQDLYDTDHSKQFADYLFKTNQFGLAAAEYERVLFMSPQNDSVRLALITSYRKGENFSKGLSRLAELFPENKLSNSMAQEYCRLLLLSKSFDKAKSFISETSALNKEEKFIMSLNAELLNKKWAAGKSIYYSEPGLKESSLLSSYKNIVDEGASLKYKSPYLAMMFSGIVPGSGKFYAHDGKDGLLSFVFIGVAALQAYRGFSKSGVNSTYGWVYATLGFGFYTGNIYGSYKSAKKYNSSLDDNLYKKAESVCYSDF